MTNKLMSIHAMASSSSFSSRSVSRFLFLSLFLFLVIFSSDSSAQEDQPAPAECQVEKLQGSCYNKSEALRLKVIAIFVILITSMIGVCLPLLSDTIKYLRPDGNPFAIVKAFASGVILATGYMHVLPDSFANLNSPCLPEKPWRVFPFTAFVAMISAIFVLMLDSFMMTFHGNLTRKKSTKSKGGGIKSNIAAAVTSGSTAGQDIGTDVPSHGHGGFLQHPQGASHPAPSDECSVEINDARLSLKRYRTIAQMLEMSIVVHSVVIGLSLGASENPCTIKPLVAALCFHQMFEGMGLGGCILQAQYGLWMKTIMFFFFSVTTPFGIALGIGLSKVYSDNDPNALIIIGILNASSAGLLNYMALVDLLAADFMGPKLQGSVSLQAWAYVAVLVGAGGMSLMSKWA